SSRDDLGHVSVGGHEGRRAGRRRDAHGRARRPGRPSSRARRRGAHPARTLTWTAGVGFEPTEPCGSTVFKTVPFDRSGTPPGGSVYAAPTRPRTLRPARPAA